MSVLKLHGFHPDITTEIRRKTPCNLQINGSGFKPNHTKILLLVCYFYPVRDTKEPLKILIDKNICQTAIS